MVLERRTVGTTGPAVGVLALGSWHTYDRMDFHDAAAVVARAVEAGVNLFDVGTYGRRPVHPGDAVDSSFTDVIFGRLVEHAGIAREQYVLSCKLWLSDWPAEPLSVQLTRSLERIGTDFADLAVLGDLEDHDIDLARLVSELAELVASGRLRAWGVNNWTVDDTRYVHDFAGAEGLPGPQMAQLKYSLCRRSIPEGTPFGSLLRERGISLQASDVLEGGVIAGKAIDGRREMGHDTGSLRERIARAAPRIAELARSADMTPAQLSIAFCLRHPSLATVLVGVTSMQQLEDNLAAFALTDRVADLPTDALDELWLDRDVVDPQGARGYWL